MRPAVATRHAEVPKSGSSRIRPVITPTTITVAASGDMATDVGTYALSVGSINDTGKYMVHLHKIANTWKIVDDMWSSDLPIPGTPAMAMDSTAK